MNLQTNLRFHIKNIMQKKNIGAARTSLQHQPCWVRSRAHSPNATRTNDDNHRCPLRACSNTFTKAAVFPPAAFPPVSPIVFPPANHKRRFRKRVGFFNHRCSSSTSGQGVFFWQRFIHFKRPFVQVCGRR